MDIKEKFRILLDFVNNLSQKWWGQLILIALPILIIFVLVDLNHKVFTQPDVLNYVYPTLYAYAFGLKNNLNILWNYYTLSGFPTFISSAGLFSPLNFIFFKYLNFFDAYHWLLAINLILGGFFTVRFLKGLGVSSLAAIMGGLAYIISVESANGIDLPLISATPILPLIFWLLLLDFKKNRWWLVLLGGLTIGFACLSVHFNWLIITLSGGFLFSLGLNWIYYQTGWWKYFKTLIRYLIMGLIGGAISLVQFFPVLVYAGLSSRSGGISYGLATSNALSLADFVSFIFPSFGLPFFTNFPFFYFGILPLIFFICSIFIKSRRSRFFVFLFGLCLVLAVSFSPLFWVLQKLPVFEYFRVPSRWIFLGLFAGSVAAAFGADKFLLENYTKTKNKILTIFKWLTTIIFSVSLLLNLIVYSIGSKILDYLKEYFDLKFYSKTTQLPIEHYHSIIEDLFNQIKGLFSFTNSRFIWPLIVLLVSYWILKYFYTRPNKVKYFLSVIVLVVGFNFIATFPFNTPVLSTVDKDVFDYKPQTVEFISGESGRSFSFLPGFTQWQKLTVPFKPGNKETIIFQSELLVPKLNNFYHIKSADGFDSMMSQKYAEIIALLGSDRAVTGEILSDLEISIEDKIKLFHGRQNLLDMLGIRYMISAYDLENDKLKRVFTTEATKYKIPIHIYENNDFLPLAYLAKEISYLDIDDPKNLDIITDNKNNFNEITFIECLECKNVHNQGGDIEVIEHKNGYIKFKVLSDSDAWVVFNENNLPGWQAFINGQNIDIYTANYLFQSVLVPAGEHEIVFNFNYFNIWSYFFDN